MFRHTMLPAAASCLAILSAAPAGAATFKTLYNFTGGADGEQPAGALYMHAGVIYGATAGSFAMGHFTCSGTLCGTVFSFDPAQSKLSTMYTFAPNSGGLFPQTGVVMAKGQFYGFNSPPSIPNDYGACFRMDPKTGQEAITYTMGAVDGSASWSAPTFYNGKLYATASDGGSGNGVIFSVDPATGMLTNHYAFSGGSDGFYPIETPVFLNGKMYGTTVYGGSGNFGTIFEWDPATNKEKVVYRFTGGSDGKWPWGEFVVDHGTLYGSVGTSSTGNVYQFDPVTEKFSIVHTLNGGSEGTDPGLLVLNKGRLYVSTGGGTTGYGTILQVDPATGKTEVVHSFTGGADGIDPETLVAYKGKLYGLTGVDETYPFVHLGTLFEITP